MKFSIFQDSRIGGRGNNEDRIGYRYTREALIMVLCDGLGGHGHGEVAAEAAVRSIITAFDQQAKPRLADPERFLANAMTGAHTAILAQSGIRQLDDLPRTTCITCVVQDGVARWAHAGDSRLYLLRGGKVAARTRDHARLNSASRNVLTSCLGSDALPQIDHAAAAPLTRGDVILLCSDGVWGPLANDTPLLQLAAHNTVQAAPGLLDRIESMAGPGRDNLSLLLMSWEDERPASAWNQEDFTRTLNTTYAHLHDKEPT